MRCCPAFSFVDSCLIHSIGPLYLLCQDVGLQGCCMGGVTIEFVRAASWRTVLCRQHNRGFMAASCCCVSSRLCALRPPSWLCDLVTCRVTVRQCIQQQLASPQYMDDTCNSNVTQGVAVGSYGSLRGHGGDAAFAWGGTLTE